MSIGELAAYVCTWLNSKNVKCVLTGGACVSIYTGNQYLSHDLDFIDTTFTARKEIIKYLKEIGFKQKDRYFIHKETEFFIEFPAGPVSAGEEPIHKFKQINFNTGKLVLLTPTDSVKDRLAAFYHWDDKQALEQGILIAKKRRVDIKELKRWSGAEGHAEKFKKINKFLKIGRSK